MLPFTCSEEADMGYYDVIQPVDGVATYDGDFTAWAFDQARRLRALQSNDIDVAHVAEEIEDRGKEEVARLESFLRLIILHMLKWDYQPNRRSRSWRNSVMIQRKHAAKHLKKNPSLKHVLDQEFGDAYEVARLEAIDETGLPDRIFPETNPYTFDTIMNRELRLDDPE